jgi:hypothetical protein
MTPGTYPDLSFEDYLRIDAASKGRLREIWKRTPAHARTHRGRTPETDWGTALHVGILEPDRFDAAVKRGPSDRRGNKWKEALAEFPSALVLPDHEYDAVVQARDTALSDPTLRALASREGVSEATGLWIDPNTGLLCRMRTDRYVPSLALMADVKTTADAGEDAFRRVAEHMLYDLHDAMYSEGWGHAGGGEVEDFIFVVVERDPPYAHAIYQFDEPERNRGRQIMRKALARYAECLAAGSWPGHPAGVVRLKYKDWVHQADAANGLYQEEAAL